MAEPEESIAPEDSVPQTTKTMTRPRERPGDQEEHLAATAVASDVAVSQEVDAKPTKAAAAPGALEQWQDDRVGREVSQGDVLEEEKDDGRQRRVVGLPCLVHHRSHHRLLLLHVHLPFFRTRAMQRSVLLFSKKSFLVRLSVSFFPILETLRVPGSRMKSWMCILPTTRAIFDESRPRLLLCTRVIDEPVSSKLHGHEAMLAICCPSRPAIVHLKGNLIH